MALIPEDKIAEIRDRTDIVAVIGDYVTLKRAGASWKGLCPFHNERSPSFNVIPQRQFFHCFGCGKSGDVFTFVGEMEGRSFVEVARGLAEKAGVELPEHTRNPRDVERQRAEETERQKLVRLHELAASFYQEQLASDAGAAARAYLASRGIADEVAAAFSVGYAPPGWEALVRCFEAKKVPHELAERSGLVRRRESARLPAGAPPTRATHYDGFVDRVVYALTSPVGEILGFGGRILDGDRGARGGAEARSGGSGTLSGSQATTDQPKYKNSPETLIYKKGEQLFGLHRAKHAIRKGGRALVVEGNFDVMTLHQVGLDYTVAPQGTAMTEAQVKLLARFAREVVLMLDADPAGKAATLKVARLFADAELPARFAQIRAVGGKKTDPDELARTDLPRLKALVDGAIDLVEFAFAQVAATAEPTVPGRVRAVEECVPLLRALKKPLERSAYATFLAKLLGLQPELVDRALRATPQVAPRHPITHAHPNAPGADPHPNATGADPHPNAPEPPGPDGAVVEEPSRALARGYFALVELLSQHPTLIGALTIDDLHDTDVRALLEGVRNLFTEQGPEALAGKDWVALAPSAIRHDVARACMQEHTYGGQGVEVDPRSALKDILATIRRPEGRDALESERRQALERGDHARFRELTNQIQLEKIRERRTPTGDR